MHYPGSAVEGYTCLRADYFTYIHGFRDPLKVDLQERLESREVNVKVKW